MDPSKRLVSLDAFRGLVIAFMITVNTPGSWQQIYAPLRHASWHGCTPTDLVFPFFLFIVGVAMWFAFRKYNHTATPDAVRKVLRRTGLIFLLGLLMNAYPFIKLSGDQTFWQSLADYYGNMRIMNVFQRIALAYGIGSFIVLYTTRKTWLWIGAGILLGYWGIMAWLGGPDPYSLADNFARQVDLFIFGENHVYNGFGIPFDPEGLFSTLPAIVTVLIGYETGRMITSAKSRPELVNDLYLYGAIAVFTGYAWGQFFPINKPLWTSSYVLYTGGLAMMMLALFILLIDIKGYQKWTYPLRVFGMNPLFLYVLSVFWVKTMSRIVRWTTEDGRVMTGLQWIYQNICIALLGDNPNGSLLFALMHIFFYWLILRELYKRKIYIKI
jgi:predicted acyltransferase